MTLLSIFVLLEGLVVNLFGLVFLGDRALGAWVWDLVAFRLFRVPLLYNGSRREFVVITAALNQLWMRVGNIAVSCAVLFFGIATLIMSYLGGSSDREDVQAVPSEFFPYVWVSAQFAFTVTTGHHDWTVLGWPHRHDVDLVETFAALAEVRAAVRYHLQTMQHDVRNLVWTMSYLSAWQAFGSQTETFLRTEMKELLDSELKTWLDTLLEEYAADLRKHLLEVSCSTCNVSSPSVIALPEVQLLGHRVDFDPSLPLLVSFIVVRHASPPDARSSKMQTRERQSRTIISRYLWRIPVALRLAGGRLPWPFLDKILIWNGTCVNGEQLAMVSIVFYVTETSSPCPRCPSMAYRRASSRIRVVARKYGNATLGPC